MKKKIKKANRKLRWNSGRRIYSKESRRSSSSSMPESKTANIPPAQPTPSPAPAPPASTPTPEPSKIPPPKPAGPVAGNKWPLAYIAFGCILAVFVVSVCAMFVVCSKSKGRRKKKDSFDGGDDDEKRRPIATSMVPLYPDPPSYSQVRASDASLPIYIPSPTNVRTDKE